MKHLVMDTISWLTSLYLILHVVSGIEKELKCEYSVIANKTCSHHDHCNSKSVCMVPSDSVENMGGICIMRLVGNDGPSDAVISASDIKGAISSKNYISLLIQRAFLECKVPPSYSVLVISTGVPHDFRDLHDQISPIPEFASKDAENSYAIYIFKCGVFTNLRESAVSDEFWSWDGPCWSGVEGNKQMIHFFHPSCPDEQFRQVKNCTCHSAVQDRGGCSDVPIRGPYPTIY